MKEQKKKKGWKWNSQKKRRNGHENWKPMKSMVKKWPSKCHENSSSPSAENNKFSKAMKHLLKEYHEITMSFTKEWFYQGYETDPKPWPFSWVFHGLKTIKLPLFKPWFFHYHPLKILARCLKKFMALSRNLIFIVTLSDLAVVECMY